MSLLDKKNVPVLSAIFCHEKMLEYAYNWQLWKENTDVFKTAKILSVSAPELMLQAKPRWNIKQEMSWIFEALFYYRLLIWLWMCCERAYALCRSSKMSAALWRICRHIIGRLAIRDYIYQGSARCPLLKLLRNLQVARIHPCDSEEKAYFHERYIIEEICEKHLEDWF